MPGYPKSWPFFEIPVQEDKCFEPSKECVLLKYTMLYYYGYFPLKVTEVICKDPRIPCSKYCEKFGEVKSISDCKVSIFWEALTQVIPNPGENLWESLVVYRLPSHVLVTQFFRSIWSCLKDLQVWSLELFSSCLVFAAHWKQ